jgi:hypothetical protein
VGKYQNAKDGLRDKITKNAVALYPQSVQGNDEQVEKTVKYWYYQQSCAAENELNDLFVDVLTETEAKNLANSVPSCDDCD